MNSLTTLIALLAALATTDADLSSSLSSINCAAFFPPQVLKISDVTFYLYTPNNKNTPNILNVNSSLENTNFNQLNRCTFFVHGWQDSYQGYAATTLKNNILSKFTDNVFLVDWSGLASNPIYIGSVGVVDEIGKAVGNFAYKMKNDYSISAANFMMIGHSLGAHIIGDAGLVTPIGNIVGLDPAGPCYTKYTINQITPLSGLFVEIVHTNAGQYGNDYNCGVADYWPNLGAIQPGCDPSNVTCSHYRSVEFYAASILINGFTSTNNITGSPSFLGHYNIDNTANGSYSLVTGATYPYSLG